MLRIKMILCRNSYISIRLIKRFIFYSSLSYIFPKKSLTWCHFNTPWPRYIHRSPLYILWAHTLRPINRISYTILRCCTSQGTPITYSYRCNPTKCTTHVYFIVKILKHRGARIVIINVGSSPNEWRYGRLVRSNQNPLSPTPYAIMLNEKTHKYHIK